jgi:hypothetical protein
VCFQADYLDRIAKQELRLSKVQSSMAARQEHFNSYQDIANLVRDMKKEITCPPSRQLLVPRLR